MTSTPESRQAAFNRANNAAELILKYDDVKAELKDTWATLAAIKASTYFADFKKGKARTPRRQKTSTSIGVIEVGIEEEGKSFGTRKEVGLSRHMSTLHESQLAAIAAVATSNGQEAGPLIDEARLALDEAFKNSPPVVSLDKQKPTETTVAMETDLSIGGIDYRLRSRPTILLREEGYDRDRATGLALIGQFIASDEILRNPLVTLADLEDENKVARTEQEQKDIQATISDASVGLLTRNVSEHSR